MRQGGGECTDIRMCILYEQFHNKTQVIHTIYIKYSHNNASHILVRRALTLTLSHNFCRSQMCKKLTLRVNLIYITINRMS